jgi:hypothetical protein
MYWWVCLQKPLHLQIIFSSLFCRAIQIDLRAVLWLHTYVCNDSGSHRFLFQPWRCGVHSFGTKDRGFESLPGYTVRTSQCCSLWLNMNCYCVHSVYLPIWQKYFFIKQKWFFYSGFSSKMGQKSDWRLRICSLATVLGIYLVRTLGPASHLLSRGSTLWSQISAIFGHFKRKHYVVFFSQNPISW